MIFLPVGQYLHIQSHLNIQEVLVLPQVAGHVKFAVYELIFKILDCILSKKVDDMLRRVFVCLYVLTLQEAEIVIPDSE